MAHSRADLVEDLLGLGVAPDAVVMLHASVRAVGNVIGGPDEIHRAVEEAAGPAGTVMMYVGCQNGFDDVGRGFFAPDEEAEILAHMPAFDPQTARASREFGALAEFFRSFPGTAAPRRAYRTLPG